MEAIGAIASLLGAAANGLLRRFDADDGHAAGGYATSAAWLAAKTKLGRRDAKAAARQMRLLDRHPLLDEATATGAVTISRAREIAGWTGRIDDEGLRSEADRILLDAAAGADLDDLRLIAQAAYEAWREREPDPDDDPRGGAADPGQDGHGGPTSVRDCVLLRQYHHDTCIHRQGWKSGLLPDGSTRVTSPDGQVTRSHPPPPAPHPGGQPRPARPGG